MLTLTLTLLLPMASSIAAAAPRLGADITLAGSDVMTVDRVPMQLHRYRTRLPPAAVLALWPDGRAPAGPSSGAEGGWRMVSRLRGATHETLQARPGAAGGSDVLLSHVDLDARLAPAVALPVSLPSGSTLVRTVAFDDAAGRASQFVVVIPDRPQRTLALLCRLLAGAGWRAVGAAGCTTAVEATSLWFVRGAETLGLDLRAQGTGTRAVIGHVVPR